MKKRGLALILSLVMILSAFPMTTFGAEGTGFTDMPNNWSTAALKRAIANGLLEGFDGKIRAQDSLTRAEMATVVNKAFKPVKKASLSKYKDIVQGDWYYEEMAKAVHMKTFVGSGDKLNPKQKITREEAFAVLSRAFNILEKDDTVLDKFPDKNDISKWAKDEVAAIISSGYVVGSDGKINPKKNITRAEFAQIMDGLIKTYISKEGVYTKDLEGNVMINKSGVILKGITITGDLFIGDGVGDGNVTLEDVTVTGKIVLSGVGEDSIKIVGKTILKVSAINATTISVTFEGVEEPVEITLDKALTHGDNEVTFTHEDVEYTATVNYVDENVTALGKATSAVVKAEKSKSQADVETAKTLVSALPKSETKNGLEVRLESVQEEIDLLPQKLLAEIKASEEAIAKLPEDITLEDKEIIIIARNLVEKVLDLDKDAEIRGIEKLKAAEVKIAIPVTIIGYYGSDRDIKIPRLIDGNKINNGDFDGFEISGTIGANEVGIVTSIGDSVFSFNEFTSVTIPDSVTSIGDSAFCGNGLTSVTIPDSVTSIGDSAFSANELTSVTIPDSVTSIGDWAFSQNKLTSVTFPKGITSIGDSTFRSNSFTSVTIPDSVTSIGDKAFSQNGLTSVTIPDSVTSIGDWAFSYNDLTSVKIPDSVTSIGNKAFYFNLLTSVTIPDSVTSIGDKAFNDNLLTSVTIPDNVRIGNELLDSNNNKFREIYLLEGGGTYTGTQYGEWTKQ